VVFELQITGGMKPYYLITLFAGLPAMAQAQLFTFGVKGGTTAQTPLGQTDRVPFILGATVDIRLVAGLSLESGVVFHRLGQELQNGVFQYPDNSVTLVSSTIRGRAFEVPFLAKYHFLGQDRRWRPFVTAGPTIRRASLDGTHYSSILSGAALTALPTVAVGDTSSVKWNVDPVFGAGVDFKTGRFHLGPEVRYSYWGAGKNSEILKNQVDLLLGFRF